MGWVGCYILYLYCDEPGCDEMVDLGDSPRNERKAFKYARQIGWKLVRKYSEDMPKNGVGKVLCPLHSGLSSGSEPKGMKMSELRAKYSPVDNG